MALLVNKFVYTLLGLCLSGAAYAVPAVVDYVLDGDTFAAAVNIAPDIAITVRVRLTNVDTPEIKGGCASEISLANQAKQITSDLLSKGATVELNNIKDDKYLGRIDASVALPDGRDLGEILIQKGVARKYYGGTRQPWCEN